eukprot:1194317-Prorocentrum_minimum.AAC.3
MCVPGRRWRLGAAPGCGGGARDGGAAAGGARVRKKGTETRLAIGIDRRFVSSGEPRNECEGAFARIRASRKLTPRDPRRARAGYISTQ